MERFWSKVAKTDSCWLWTASKNKAGYGKFGRGGKRGGWEYAHRWAYECLVGPIPEGLHIDHLCRVHHCVNPEHLEPVTCLENVRRGIGAEAARARQVGKTHCPHGHAYDEENTYVCPRRGWRLCRACRREKKREQVALHDYGP